MAQPRRDLEWPISLDRQSSRSLTNQLVEQFRSAILRGQLAPGTRVPATRSLARALGISRTTTFNAFERLLSEGYLVARPGSGTRVSEELPAVSQPRPLVRATAVPRWLHRPPLGPYHVDTAPAGMMAFSTGVTALPPSSLTRWQRNWRRCADQAPPSSYGAPEGDPAFRAVIAAYLGRARGLASTADDIVVTGGTLRGLDLLLGAALLPGDVVGMEEPGYPLARQLLLSHGLRLAPLPVDEDGLRVADLPTGTAAPRAIYVTPSHQYPLGGRLSVGRRCALLEWANANDALVVEDDYDSEFRFDAPPFPALAALDDTRSRVAYLGTFSKVLTPSVRCGYMVVPPVLRERVIQRILLTEFHPSWLIQQALMRFVREGHLELHIRRVRQHYALLRATLARELALLAPYAQLRGPDAGLHAVLEVPRHGDIESIIHEAAASGVLVGSLDEFYLGEPTVRGLMLGYGGLSVDAAMRGARHLVRIIQSKQRADGLAPPFGWLSM